MRKTIILLVVILLFIGCKTEKKENKTKTFNFPELNEEFQNFIDKFPEVKLPLKLKDSEYNFEGLEKLKANKHIPNQNESIYILGKIKTNGNYLAILCLEESQGLIPIVTTFKLNGEKIQSENLMIGLCGPDPCFECEETLNIDNELNISVKHHSKYFECDENGVYKNKVTEEKIISKNAKLEINGKIRIKEN